MIMMIVSGTASRAYGLKSLTRVTAEAIGTTCTPDGALKKSWPDWYFLLSSDFPGNSRRGPVAFKAGFAWLTFLGVARSASIPVSEPEDSPFVVGCSLDVLVRRGGMIGDASCSGLSS